MRTIWGSVQGERFWNMLRGNDIEEITTKTSTIGHVMCYIQIGEAWFSKAHTK